MMYHAVCSIPPALGSPGPLADTEPVPHAMSLGRSERIVLYSAAPDGSDVRVPRAQPTISRPARFGQAELAQRGNLESRCIPGQGSRARRRSQRNWLNSTTWSGLCRRPTIN